MIITIKNKCLIIIFKYYIIINNRYIKISILLNKKIQKLKGMAIIFDPIQYFKMGKNNSIFQMIPIECFNQRYF